MGSATEQRESFKDVLGVLRQAARGDFDGSTGMVSENFMILMGRGLDDSWCAAFQEYADRLQAAHERELENALDAHALQAAIENDDDKRYSMQKVLEILKRGMTEAGE